MALLPIHQYFSLNGILKPCKEFEVSENESGIYEVIRIEQGVPLFWEEHIGRFYHSAEIAENIIRFSSDQIAQFVNQLIKKNKVSIGNVLISCKINLKAFFIQHSYPTDEQYMVGVDCAILNAERNNPNAKVFQTDIRTKANRILSEQGVYEVVLVDHEDKVTEGSRSNLFFIKGEKVFTPLAKKVLLGITREKAIKCAGDIGAALEERDVLLSELSSFDAAFLTGTSPKILPVKKIGNVVFNTDHPILKELMDQYNIMINDYIAENKSKHPSQLQE